jgi:hypothetical protein
VGTSLGTRFPVREEPPKTPLSFQGIQSLLGSDPCLAFHDPDLARRSNCGSPAPIAVLCGLF